MSKRSWWLAGRRCSLCRRRSTRKTRSCTRGDEVFQYWCAACHAPGPRHPGTQALEVLYKGAKPAALEQRTDLVPELTRTFVRTAYRSCRRFARPRSATPISRHSRRISRRRRPSCGYGHRPDVRRLADRIGRRRVHELMP